MPLLETLHIYCSDLEILRDAHYSNSFMSHFHQTSKLIAEMINRYIAPVSCKQLPMLIVPSASEVMVGKEEQWQGKLMYVPTGHGSSKGVN